AEEGPNQASIVRGPGLYFIVASVFADADGNPGVSYTNLSASNSVTAVNVGEEITEQTFWDPKRKQWTGGVQTSAGFWIRQRDYVDKKNVMTSIGWDAISRTAERGKEGYVFRVPGLVYLGGEIDQAEFRKTGSIRMFGMTEDHKVRV